MEDKVLKRNIESAGGWFVAEYGGFVFKNYDDLQNNKDIKSKWILKIYDEQHRDKNCNGTRTRLNAVIRIVGDGKLVEALKYIRESIRITKYNPELIPKIDETLMMLRN